MCTKINKDMKTYSDEEIKLIKAKEWDSGWRWGLFAATVAGIITIVLIEISSK